MLALAVVPLPVTDVDRALAFYTERVGFNRGTERFDGRRREASERVLAVLGHVLDTRGFSMTRASFR
jgi:hypothetical protein